MTFYLKPLNILTRQLSESMGQRVRVTVFTKGIYIYFFITGQENYIQSLSALCSGDDRKR